MDKPHRWAVVITVAVADEGTPIQDAIGTVVSLAQPHKVSGVICYDCGMKREAYSDGPCAVGPRAGYPTGIGSA